MVDILSAVLTDGLVAVEAAPHPKAAGRLGGPEDAEALGDGVHSADVILDILVPTPRDRDRVGTPGRQREAGPSLTIATPVAHPMAAGCHGDPGGTQARLRTHGRLRPPPPSRMGTASGGPSDGAFRDPRRPKSPGGRARAVRHGGRPLNPSGDEIVTTAVKRQHEPQRIIGDLLAAEINEKQARARGPHAILIAWGGG